MSKAVKTIVSVAVAVAIPFVAPVIASSAALAGITSTIGMTATSALVGAGLGAANAAITGGDVGQGALIGGIGGGISGYNYTPAPTIPGGAPVYELNSAGQIVPVDSGSGYANIANQQAAGLTNVPTPDSGSGYSNMANVSLGADSAAPVSGGSDYSNITNVSYGADPAAQQAAGLDTAAASVSSQAVTPSAVDAANLPPAPPAKTFAEALASVPGEIAAKFKDPKALADLTLRAAGQLAGVLIAGDGMSDEEKRLLEAQTNELRQLQQTNKALFDQKLQQAQDLIGESAYFDPEYFGLQRARRAQLVGAKVKGGAASQGGLRGLTGSRRAAEERRIDLATGRDVGTAFDQGYGTAIGGRIQTMQAGLNAMPGYFDYTTPSITAGLNAQNLARTRRKEEREGVQNLFGTLTSV